MDRKERLMKLSAISKELWRYVSFYVRDEELSDEMWDDCVRRFDAFAKKYDKTEFKSYVNNYIIGIESYLATIERNKSK